MPFSEIRTRIWHLPRNRTYVDEADVYIRMTRYRYEWAHDVRQHAKQPPTQAVLLIFVITTKRYPRRMVHASFTDVGGPRGQSFADLYVKLVLKSEFCRGRRAVVLKDRNELTEKRREALRDIAAEEYA